MSASGEVSPLKMSSATAVEPAKNPAWEAYIKITDTLTVLFPLWTVLFAGLALVRPSSFSWFSTKYFTASLGALMLSMGITLTAADFQRVAQQPGPVAIGFILCYVLCPALGFFLGKAFNLPLDLIAGLVLVGSVNGGQASNLCTYIAKGDVALSVLMTTVTTIAGIFTTPLLCKLILGAVVPVDAVGIAVSCMQVEVLVIFFFFMKHDYNFFIYFPKVVLAPIALGMSLNKLFPKVVEKLLPAKAIADGF
jgi:BASS family bile acid:Na+ symporter